MTSVSSSTCTSEKLLSILEHQKGLLEHRRQTLTATRQQLKEQAVSLRLNEEPAQPSQAPEDSKAGLERILLIEEECIR